MFCFGQEHVHVGSLPQDPHDQLGRSAGIQSLLSVKTCAGGSIHRFPPDPLHHVQPGFDAGLPSIFQSSLDDSLALLLCVLGPPAWPSTARVTSLAATLSLALQHQHSEATQCSQLGPRQLLLLLRCLTTLSEAHTGQNAFSSSRLQRSPTRPSAAASPYRGGLTQPSDSLPLLSHLQLLLGIYRSILAADEVPGFLCCLSSTADREEAAVRALGALTALSRDAR